MEKDNAIKAKSFEFAVQIVKLCKKLTEEKKEFILSKQLLRSGTSIGANVEEAVAGISMADFSAKMSIAYKEAQETSYAYCMLRSTWIEKVSTQRIRLT